MPGLDIVLLWSMVGQMIFIEDHGFQKRRKGLMDDEELFGLISWLAEQPEAGKVIPASGGLRKARWAARGHGKRGGVRVIYFWWIADDKILLLDIYAKGDQENLAADEIEKLRRKVIQ
jgi:hypothetical protein